MATATSRRAARPGLAAAVAAAALFAAGCGTQASSSSSAVARQTPTEPPAFAGLRALGVPGGWSRATIAGGATLAYPPGWKQVDGDPGTATAALLGPRHQYLGYVNLTPRQGNERLSAWARFRVGHNVDEGDRNVRTLAVSGPLRLRPGTARCVKDAYSTSKARFVELACLLVGPRTSLVIVGAAPPKRWTATAPQIKRAIDVAMSDA